MDDIVASRPGTYVHPVRVYYEDTDTAGIVYYANYLKFAERARTEMLRALGFDQVRIRAEADVAFAVRACNIEYLRPARLDEALTVETEVTKVGGASIGLIQTVKRGAETLVAMDVTLVCIRADGKAGRVPADVRAALDAVSTAVNGV
jgi:acyl-CoA thioester hydrolase